MESTQSLSEWAESQLGQLSASHLLRKPPVLRSKPGTTVQIEGDEVLCLCSNDYLGFASHEATLQMDGNLVSGSGSSRLVAGNLRAMLELEKEASAYCHFEDALFLASGFTANLGTIPALTAESDIIYSDSLNHASLIDGCRLSKACIVVYPHRDLSFLEAELTSNRRKYRHAWVVTDALFSMEGDTARLRELRELADRNRAFLYVDEAHSMGVYGKQGRGLSEEAGVRPDILMFGLGKAFGTQGAFVLSHRPVVQLLKNLCRSYVYTTGPSPVLVHLARNALKQVQGADRRRAALRENISYLRHGLEALGLTVGGERNTPILYVQLGQPAEAIAASKALLEKGVFVQAIRPPTVPIGTSRLRIVPTALHSLDQMDFAIQSFGEVRNAYCFT